MRQLMFWLGLMATTVLAGAQRSARIGCGRGRVGVRSAAAVPGDHARLVILVALLTGIRTSYPSSLLTDTRILYPEPRVIQLPATTHFFGSKSACVTRICDMGGRRDDQDGPR